MKNIFDGLNSTLQLVEERISNYEDMTVKMFQLERKNKKDKKKQKNSMPTGLILD